MTTEVAAQELWELWEAARLDHPPVFNVWGTLSGRDLDPSGVFSVEGAKRAYVRGAIDIEEFEHRVELLLRTSDWLAEAA